MNSINTNIQKLINNVLHLLDPNDSDDLEEVPLEIACVGVVG